jgi:hypothetical protein
MIQAWASREFWPTRTYIVFDWFTVPYHVSEMATETDEDHWQNDSCWSIHFYLAKRMSHYGHQTGSNAGKTEFISIESERCILRKSVKKKSGPFNPYRRHINSFLRIISYKPCNYRYLIKSTKFQDMMIHPPITQKSWSHRTSLRSHLILLPDLHRCKKVQNIKLVAESWQHSNSVAPGFSEANDSALTGLQVDCPIAHW